MRPPSFAASPALTVAFLYRLSPEPSHPSRLRSISVGRLLPSCILSTNLAGLDFSRSSEFQCGGILKRSLDLLEQPGSGLGMPSGFVRSWAVQLASGSESVPLARGLHLSLAHPAPDGLPLAIAIFLGLYDISVWEAKVYCYHDDSQKHVRPAVSPHPLVTLYIHVIGLAP